MIALFFVWRLLIVATAAIAGVYLRPYLLSDWGPYAFVLGVWLAMALTGSWRGRDKPYAPIFGFVLSSAIAIMLLITFHTNAYVGAAGLSALAFLGIKTGFFEKMVNR